MALLPSGLLLLVMEAGFGDYVLICSTPDLYSSLASQHLLDE